MPDPSGRHKARAEKSRQKGGAWCRYKNRKKTIRQRYQRQEIDEAERDRLMEEARRCYLTGEMSDAAAAHLDRVKAATEWLAGNDIPDRDAIVSGNCNEECVAARALCCSCDCAGVNHGAARGTEPWDVYVKGWTRAERVAAGLLLPKKDRHHDIAADFKRSRT